MSSAQWIPNPDDWQGRTVAVLASGPSMSAEVADSVRDARIPCIAVNNTFRIARWAEVLYAADRMWWMCHAQEALQFAGIKATRDPIEFSALMHVGGDPPGACSAYGAARLAALCGAERVLLFGVDLAGANWHGLHQPPLRTSGAPEFIRMRQVWRDYALPVPIFNCSPLYTCDVFPRARLEDFV